MAIAPALAQCAGAPPFSSQLVDVLECSAIGGAAIAAIGSNGVPISGAAATTAGDGSFALCLPQGSAFSIQMTAAGYPTSYLAELLNADAGYVAQMPMISTGSITALTSIVPNFEPDKALIVVKLTGSSQYYPGWTFDIALPDGGPVPDGGAALIYLGGGSIPDPTATMTSGAGSALIYDLDPSISDFFLVSVSNGDAGSASLVGNSAAGFTGRVYAASGAVTIDPILLP